MILTNHHACASCIAIAVTIVNALLLTESGCYTHAFSPITTIATAAKHARLPNLHWRQNNHDSDTLPPPSGLTPSRFTSRYTTLQSPSLLSSSSSWSRLSMGKRPSAQIMSQPWLPENHHDDDIYAIDVEREDLERKSIEYLAFLIRNKGYNNRHGIDSVEHHQDGSIDELEETMEMKLVRDRFRDFTCTYDGELEFERLFDTRNVHLEIQQWKERQTQLEDEDDEDNDNVFPIAFANLEQIEAFLDVSVDTVRGAVIAMQSLLILGMQVGVKGTPEQKERSVAHLKKFSDNVKRYNDNNAAATATATATGATNQSFTSKVLEVAWNQMDARHIKHKGDITAGMQLLAELKRKRSARSAFDLLNILGIWTTHEDIALLRSGFHTRFTKEEENAAVNAAESDHDPDEILGLRRDLRHLKTYTIDSEYTDEIDDGLSIENVKGSESNRKRIWIHIADADRWAPRDSDIFKAAEARATSLYLPSATVPMFPIGLSGGPMSLRAGHDSFALSLGVELNEDGSIDESTLQITPSLINVDYRLAYDEVDEMLEMGVAYFEEWELGALLAEANKRRKYRISCGSTEGFVPLPIPQAELRVVQKDAGENGDGDGDDVDILLNVEVTHNTGLNQSASVLNMSPSVAEDFAPPVSSAFLLVTEMMIMSGEAMGKLKGFLESKARTKAESYNGEAPTLENELRLPYRTQPKPDFARRYQELNTLDSLRDKGYCHAWYARRFFEPVRVKEEPLPHHGLGLDCYVQWSSPIRRFSDLQVHASVKRHLRRDRVNDLMHAGKPIPEALSASDLGCEVPRLVDTDNHIYEIPSGNRPNQHSINYRRGWGFVNAARMVQKKSREYWLFEFIQRQIEGSESEISFETTVLACVDPQRGQYAIYVHDLGLEHRYLSEKGQLEIGERLWLKVSSVAPRLGLLTFTLSSRYGGRSSKRLLE